MSRARSPRPWPRPARPAFYVHPGEASHGDLGMITDADVVLALSYSGESDEILLLLPVLKRQGNQLIAMTGRPKSSHGARGRRAPGRQRAGRSLPARPRPDLQHHRRRSRWATRSPSRCWKRAASPPTTSRARIRPARWAAACCCTSPTSCMPATTCPRVRADATLSEALVEMSRKRLGMTAVVDADGRLLGLYTDGDLRRTLDDARHRPAQHAASST